MATRGGRAPFLGPAAFLTLLAGACQAVVPINALPELPQPLCPRATRLIVASVGGLPSTYALPPDPDPRLTLYTDAPLELHAYLKDVLSPRGLETERLAALPSDGQEELPRGDTMLRSRDDGSWEEAKLERPPLRVRPVPAACRPGARIERHSVLVSASPCGIRLMRPLPGCSNDGGCAMLVVMENGTIRRVTRTGTAAFTIEGLVAEPRQCDSREGLWAITDGPERDTVYVAVQGREPAILHLTADDRGVLDPSPPWSGPNIVALAGGPTPQGFELWALGWSDPPPAVALYRRLDGRWVAVSPLSSEMTEHSAIRLVWLGPGDVVAIAGDTPAFRYRGSSLERWDEHVRAVLPRGERLVLAQGWTSFLQLEQGSLTALLGDPCEARTTDLPGGVRALVDLGGRVAFVGYEGIVGVIDATGCTYAKLVPDELRFGVPVGPETVVTGGWIPSYLPWNFGTQLHWMDLSRAD